MRFILRRLGFYVFATWVALTITFLLPRLMPGDPIGGVLQHLSPAEIQSNPGIIETYRKLLGGGDQSIWSAYVQYLQRVVTMNFGISTSNYPSKVSEVVGRTLPYSIVLVGIAFLIAFVLGTMIGMIAAWRRGGGVDTLFVPVFMALGAFPAYFTGLIVVYFLGLKLGWFPINHAYDNGSTPGFNWPFVSGAVRHGILPALTIVLAYAGGWVLNMRTVMINTISEDYVAMGHAKGLRDTRVMTRYAARNAILPSVSSFSLAIGFVVSGALLTEVVFSYPGLGFILLTAVQQADYSLLQGIFLVITLAVLIVNLIADFVYVFLDPRTRQEA